jgi:hypothetical protein
MDSRQMRILFGVIALVFLAWLISPLLFATRESVLPLTKSRLWFDASQAYRMTQEFITQYPSRVLGSLESRQSTGFLHDYLEKLGYEISYSHFDARIAGRKKVGRNVLAYKRGQSPEILALVAHFDTARTTVQGAMKNGAGVGVLLEMARIFAANPTRRSLLFILSDGEEWGMLGANDLANSYPERNRIVGVLSLDHVGIGDLAAFCLDETGQGRGFTPPWLRAIARQAAEAQGLPLLEPSRLREHIERAFLISWADQGPFLKAGIPAINLGSKSADQAREKAVYHSAQDTLENLRVASIGKFGQVAERILRSLDELQSTPLESSESFRLWDSHFLKPKMILPLHILSFLPLPVIFYFHLRNYSKRLSLIGIGREMLAYLGTILPFLTAYFAISLFCALRLIPLYSLYPATAKDPVIQNPPWAVMGGIFGIALFVAIICYAAAKFSFRSLPQPDFHISKLVLLALLLLAAILALAYNSYWASAFFILPAWIWALVGNGRQLSERVKNWLWILAAGIPYFLALWIFASRLGMGWSFAWYQVLALNTGLFTTAGYFLGAAAVALGIRFLAIQNHKSRV